MSFIDPIDVVSKNFLLKKYEPVESEFNSFLDLRKNLIDEILAENLRSKSTDDKLESFIEGRIVDFLQKTFYQPTHYVGKPANESIDLVILDEKEPNSTIRVIFEVKSLKNKGEFPVLNNEINVKALQETVLYYLRESVSYNNKGIRHIVITNGIEWLIFDAQDYEQLFVKGNKKLVREFKDFESKRSASTSTEVFYSSTAKSAIEAVKDKLEYVYFNIEHLQKKADLIAVFKILSPYYLLKEPCANDSNTLNDKFYKELLHIIGLYEKTEKGKKTIERLPDGKREKGSLLENAITQLGYKSTSDLFERALQSVIVWINRILFLKLLEAQLLKWHNGDTKFKFMTPQNLPEYDEMKELFFGVVAKRVTERLPELDKYKFVPYLNSSLFEPTEELSIAELKDNVKIPVYKESVLETKGYMNPLEYLLRFLDAYDFGADSNDNGLRKENKTLINASVLGLIFEKINGYKDGSFYTPGHITNYMAKEAVECAVVQKFNDIKGWNCKNIDDIAENIKDRVEANQIINSIRICDPAVGSGHFLVSILNRFLFIKSYLNILLDKDNKRINNSDWELRLENDEISVWDENGNMFTYTINPDTNTTNTNRQRVQETLFNEKRIIIENCLFGVDINPNSVNICRLRLWIELLKNAYYHPDGTLETLPNIDINIKCGNSLVSHYPITIGQSVRGNGDIPREIKEYKATVKKYKQENDKSEKQKVKTAIAQIKRKIAPDIQLQLELDDGFASQNREALENHIYSNSMEWMIEFPEVLDDEGRYQGFDVVIGNPPWGADMSKDLKAYLKNKFPEIDSSTPNSFAYFIGWGLRNYTSSLMFVLPDSVLIKDYKKTRELLSTNVRDVLWYQNSGVPKEERLFKDVEHDVCIVSLDKSNNSHVHLQTNNFETDRYVTNDESVVKTDVLKKEFDFIFNLKASQTEWTIVSKLLKYNPLSAIAQCHEGIHSGNVRAKLFIKGYKSHLKPLYYGGKAGDVIRPYVSDRNDWYVDYRKSIKDTTKGEYASLRDERIFINPKIYITRTGNPFIAFYDEESYASNNFFSLQRKEYKDNTKENLLFLLPLINSKICQFFIRKFAAPRLGDSFIETKIFHLLKFPIPSATPSQQQPIIDLVDQILVAKKANPPQDTNALEQKIDLLVYKLYGLSYDEVQVIDPDTPITESEYNM